MYMLDSFKVAEWKVSADKYDWAKSSCELIDIAKRKMNTFRAVTDDEATLNVLHSIRSDVQETVVFKITQSIHDKTRRSELKDKIAAILEAENFYDELGKVLEEHTVDRNRDVNNLLSLITDICELTYIGRENFQANFDMLETLTKRVKLTPVKLGITIQEYLRHRGTTRWRQFIAKFNHTSHEGQELTYDNYHEFLHEWEEKHNGRRLESIKKGLRSRNEALKREYQDEVVPFNKRARGQNNAEVSCNSSDSLEARMTPGGRCYHCKKFGHHAKDCPYKLSNGVHSSNSQTTASQYSQEQQVAPVLTQISSPKKTSVLYDSAASVPVFNDREWFTSIRALRTPLAFDSIGHREEASMVGTVELRVSTTDGEVVTWCVHDVV